ncbi:MAG: hypothetical protein HY289_06565, partial [Planctomycetes bacterium]|nr:hypothetical protein [Planctomycetota bacterium]
MRIFVAALVMLCLLNTIQAQEKLKTDGYGSLSGKVTLTGDLPKVTDFTGKMKDSNDKQCCLAPTAKPIEKVDQTWMVDPKTKAVKNAMVWVMPPKDTYFEINFRYKKRSEIIVIDQPHCQFLPFVSAFNPVYFDGKKLVPTGQQLIFKNSATVAHAVQAIGSLSMGNKGFNRVVASGGQLDCLKDLEEEVQFKPQLLPYNLACNT